MTPNLFAFSETGDDHHEIKLTLSREERAKVNDLPPESTGVWADVSDEDGVEWSIRRESCDFPTCFCAARAVRR